MSQTPDVPATTFDPGRLERALSAGNMVWWEMDCRTGIVSFHPFKASILGFDAKSFAHYTDFTALLHPDDLGPATEAMRGHLEGTLPEYRADYRLRTQAGDYRWFQDVGCVTGRDGEGRPVTVTGIALDITERKRIEEQLRDGQERLAAFFHGHSAVKLVIEPATGTIVDANEAAARFYGWPIPSLRRMRIQEINQLPPPEIDRAMASAMESPNARFEFRHRRADGTVRDVEVFSNRVKVGAQTLLYSIVHDISDRKRAQEALVKHERNLVHAEDFARFGHWELSLDDGIIRASSGAAKVYGLESTELPLRVVQARVLDEYRPRLDAALEALVERGEPYEVEFRIRRGSDAEIVAVQSRAEYDPRTRTVFGVVQDITERKRFEGEREALILQLQSAIEHIRTLKGILPICASCKKVRDDTGYWQQVEAYLSRHTDVQFSHGICPDCMRKHYPGY